MSTGRFSDELMLPFETPSEKEARDTETRRKMVILVSRHARSSVEFVEIVDMLGIEEELLELLMNRPDLLSAVTKARLRAQL